MAAKMSKLLLGGALLSALLGAPGHADDTCRGVIGVQEAIAIARSVGLVHVEEVECDDDGWEVEGRDARGRDIEVEIEARTGCIKDVERDG